MSKSEAMRGRILETLRGSKGVGMTTAFLFTKVADLGSARTFRNVLRALVDDGVIEKSRSRDRKGRLGTVFYSV